jgi:hypothetical protein
MILVQINVAPKNIIDFLIMAVENYDHNLQLLDWLISLMKKKKNYPPNTPESC